MDYFNQETERLKFRKVETSDIESWSEFFVDNDRLHFLGIPDLTRGKFTLAAEWINLQLERYKTGSVGHLAIIEKSTGKHIGMAGIIPRTINDQSEFEIAYSLIPNCWGKGLGTEAASQLKKFGFENKLSQRFISIIHINNTDSIKVAEKNGMSIIVEMEYLGMNVFVYGTPNQSFE